MEYNRDKVDEMVLALLWLTMFKDGEGFRAWKGYDFEVMDRLHEEGFIMDQKGKQKSVVMTEEGAKRASELFQKLFGAKS